MILAKEFEFGTGEGQYPIVGWITDSVFETGRVKGIGFGTQYYTAGFTQGARSLNYGTTFTPVNGNKIVVDFFEPLIIEKA